MPAPFADLVPARRIPACHPRLADWEILTRAAWRAQSDHRLDQALAGHVRALWTVEALLEAEEGLLGTHPDDCLAAVVVSHHSLSDLYCRRGHSAPAIGHLCAPHQLLLSLSCDANAAVQEAARRHMRETRAALLLWQRDYGEHPRIEECLQLWPPLSQRCGPAYRH